MRFIDYEVMKFNIFDVLYSMQLLFVGEASLIWLLCHFVIDHSSYLVASSFSDDKIFQTLVHCLMWTWKHSFLQETLDSFYGEKSLKTTARLLWGISQDFFSQETLVLRKYISWVYVNISNPNLGYLTYFLFILFICVLFC